MKKLEKAIEMVKAVFKFDWMSAKFVIRALLVLVIVTFILRLFGVSNISDILLLGLMAHSMTAIGLNVWEKKQKE